MKALPIVIGLAAAGFLLSRVANASEAAAPAAGPAAGTDASMTTTHAIASPTGAQRNADTMAQYNKAVAVGGTTFRSGKPLTGFVSFTAPNGSVATITVPTAYHMNQWYAARGMAMRYQPTPDVYPDYVEYATRVGLPGA